MKIICYGDSNTYGYDPRVPSGGRYSAENRWVDIIAAKTGCSAENMGQNGRTIPSAAHQFPEHADLLVVMLGTNDLLQGARPKRRRRGN